jgi:cytochrome c peroxidase
MIGSRRVRSVVACIVLWGCGSEDLVDDRFTTSEWDFIQTFRREAEPALACDAYCRALVELGHALFIDPRLSGAITVAKDSFNRGVGELGESGKVSCASCHDPSTWFIDRRSRPNASSLGTGWTGRNTPTLVDAAFQQSFSWSGKYPHITGVLELATQSPAAFNTTKDQLAEAVAMYHRPEYDVLFEPDLPGPCPMPMTPCPGTPPNVFDNVARAIGAYESRLISGPAPFDRYAGGQFDALSDSAKRGLGVFIGRGLCSECHTGAMFTDGRFHNTAVAQRGEHAASIDHGRKDVSTLAEDDGAFRTPSLRAVAETSPYMHAGQLADLAEVIDHYRWGGDSGGFSGRPDVRMLPLDIDDQDALDLEAFLRTLTGPPPDPRGQP